MVRLLHGSDVTAGLGVGCFNPTMVRLLLNLVVSPIVINPFQSHNGAIAAKRNREFVVAQLAFQSHNGAIAADF